MAAGDQEAPSPGRGRPGRDRPGRGRSTSGEVRIAAASEDPETPPWAWGATAVLILAAGLAFYLARAQLAPALDRWLPPPRPQEAPPEPAPEPVEAPAAESAAPAAPVWTFTDVEAALADLPQRTEQLIAEGRQEQSAFVGLGSRDGGRAQAIRNRWRSWGRIWHNRIRVLSEAMPPAEECARHAALEPTCAALQTSFALLRQIPDTERLADARDLLDQAATVFEELRRIEEEADAAAEGVSETEHENPTVGPESNRGGENP